MNRAKDFLKKRAVTSSRWLRSKIFRSKRYEYSPSEELMKFQAANEIEEKYNKTHKKVYLEDDPPSEPKETPNIKEFDQSLDHLRFIAGYYVNDKLVFPDNRPFKHVTFDDNIEYIQDNRPLLKLRDKVFRDHRKLQADKSNRKHKIFSRECWKPNAHASANLMRKRNICPYSM